MAKPRLLWIIPNKIRLLHSVHLIGAVSEIVRTVYCKILSTLKWLLFMKEVLVDRWCWLYPTPTQLKSVTTPTLLQADVMSYTLLHHITASSPPWYESRGSKRDYHYAHFSNVLFTCCPPQSIAKHVFVWCLRKSPLRSHFAFNISLFMTLSEFSSSL